MSTRLICTVPGSRRGAALALAIALLVVPAPWLAPLARAAPPSPIDPTLFSFPGALPNPPSARSAALALADRWLGDEPFGNPAAAGLTQIVLSPALVRMSRQDLRAGNRNYDETPAFLDGAAGALGTAWRGTSVWVYGHQSALRLEDNAFTVGPSGSVPAVITSHSELRELRAGLALSRVMGPVRVGAGFEWMRHQDLFESTENSGSPQSGSRHVDFDGSGVGGQAGLRYDHGDTTLGAFTLGVGLRFVPSLTLEGEQRFALVLGDSVASVSVERTSGWEGGVSGAMWLSPDFQVLASIGGRTSQDWSEFGVTSGAGTEWHLGGEYHDALDPWTFRFGIGEEQQSGVPEPRAGSFGLGLGWWLEGTTIDVGVLHRTVARSGKPHSYDDRILVSARIDF